MEPAAGLQVDWRSKQLTPTEEEVTLSIHDDGWISEIYPPDTGNCNDARAPGDTVYLGAFDVTGSLTVSGTNGNPVTQFTFWSQHDESLHEDEPGWVEAEGLFDGLPLAGGPISLGVADYDDTTQTDASTQLPGITFRGEWWQFDTSKDDNFIELRGGIQGKVEIVETLVMVPSGVNYENAYAKAWSDGWACFWLDDPYYSGTPNGPDPGYVP